MGGNENPSDLGLVAIPVAVAGAFLVLFAICWCCTNWRSIWGRLQRQWQRLWQRTPEEHEMHNLPPPSGPGNQPRPDQDGSPPSNEDHLPSNGQDDAQKQDDAGGSEQASTNEADPHPSAGQGSQQHGSSQSSGGDTSAEGSNASDHQGMGAQTDRTQSTAQPAVSAPTIAVQGHVETFAPFTLKLSHPFQLSIRSVEPASLPPTILGPDCTCQAAGSANLDIPQSQSWCRCKDKSNCRHRREATRSRSQVLENLDWRETRARKQAAKAPAPMQVIITATGLTRVDTEEKREEEPEEEPVDDTAEDYEADDEAKTAEETSESDEADTLVPTAEEPQQDTSKNAPEKPQQDTSKKAPEEPQQDASKKAPEEPQQDLSTKPRKKSSKPKDKGISNGTMRASYADILKK